MNYIKTNPNISYQEFYKLASQVKLFKSLTFKEYKVRSIIEDKMKFLRVDTDVEWSLWSMDLRGVHKAYLELTDFKTKNFAPYVPRTHSPALGLLLHLGLLKR